MSHIYVIHYFGPDYIQYCEFTKTEISCWRLSNEHNIFSHSLLYISHTFIYAEVFNPYDMKVKEKEEKNVLVSSQTNVEDIKPKC